MPDTGLNEIDREEQKVIKKRGPVPFREAAEIEAEVGLGMSGEKVEWVNHPDHYGGKDNPYEVVKICEAWGIDLDAYIFNAVKYLFRRDYKEDAIQDLKKSIWYIQRRVDLLEGKIFHAQEVGTTQLSESQK